MPIMRWPYKISNADMRKICEQDGIMVELARRKWRCFGLIQRKDIGTKWEKQSGKYPK